MNLEVNPKRTERLSRELAEALNDRYRWMSLTPEQAAERALIQAWQEATGKNYYEAFAVED